MKKGKLTKVFFSLTLIMIMMSNTLLISAANESHFIKDSVSESILKKGLYEDEKIQKYDSLTDGSKARHELINEKSVLNQNSRGVRNVNEHLENCVIVKTEQDIAFDTENVTAAIRYGKKYYIQYKTDSDAQAAVEIFESYPTVEYAATDGMIIYNVYDNYIEGDARTSQDVNGYTHYTWGADAMKLPIYADYISRTVAEDEEVIVAVLDSGIKAEHELFQGRLQQGHDYANDDTDPRDDQGHGTHVAGIIADCTQGLNVSILPIKVLIINKWGTDVECSSVCDLLDGLELAIEKGADVINLSMGATNSGEIDYEPFCIEIDNAVSQGIVVVAASGNNYSYIGSNNYHPAHKSNIIVTAAIDSEQHDYHNGGHGSNYGPSVDVTAPGVDVVSAFNGLYDTVNNKYVSKTGTSMAAPHISAAAAMLKLKYPNYSCAQIEEELKNCAKSLGEPDEVQHYGAGLPILSNLITSLPFYDVFNSDWFCNDILEVYKNGYMTGRSRNFFMPLDNMKRQDVAVLFYRMSDNPFIEYRTIYNDVSSEDYFANAAVWAYDNEIIMGYQDGSMGVDNNITRQDFILTLYRYANHKDLDITDTENISGYTDYAQVSEYAYTAMSWGVAKGIIGDGTTSLNPLGNASTRSSCND